jgi:hypothetical protein
MSKEETRTYTDYKHFMKDLCFLMKKHTVLSADFSKQKGIIKYIWIKKSK